MSELLQVDDLTAGYGDAIVLESLSFALAPGDSMALLGRNGMGKTTLLSTLMGLTKLHNGRMRFKAADLAALPAHSQGAERHWYFDVHRYAPSFEGHYVDTSGNNPVDVDLGRDLGLKKDSTKIGFGLEYQGPRFGVELSRDEQDYKGLNRVARTININGTDFNANTLVSSSLKATTNTFNLYNAAGLPAGPFRTDDY